MPPQDGVHSARIFVSVHPIFDKCHGVPNKESKKCLHFYLFPSGAGHMPVCPQRSVHRVPSYLLVHKILMYARMSPLKDTVPTFLPMSIRHVTVPLINCSHSAFIFTCPSDRHMTNSMVSAVKVSIKCLHFYLRQGDI